jgi:hypothetical protein
MSGMVAFEPSSLQQLSNNLGVLAQNLEGNLSKIVSLVTTSGGHVNGSGSISMWATKARDDANDMSSRAREAWELVRQGKAYRPPNFSPVFSPGMVDIDWAGTSKSGRQGQQDAKDLNLGKSATREQLAAAARSVANHKGDKVYLTQFWANADPKLVQQLARILHAQDMVNGKPNQPPLSKSSKKILADLAIGVAAATRLDTLPADKKNSLESAIENPQDHDMWSSAMLFKYGPDGSKYDPSFLKAMGAKALDWRSSYGGMPSRVSPNMYAAPDGAWYTSLGIVGPWPTTGGGRNVQDWDHSARTVADNDPAASILDRVGQNSAASRALLQSKEYAEDLVKPNWVVPTFGGDQKDIDISGSPGRVIVAGTANRAKFPTETANAALNVFSAAAKLRKGYPDDVGDVDGNLSLKAQLPPELTRALAVMGTQYIPEALSAADGHRGSTVLSDDRKQVDLTTTDLKTYLSLLAKDPTALGIYRGGIDHAISEAARQKLLKGGSISDGPWLVGELYGLAALAAANENYGKAAAADMAAARNLQLLTTTVGIATGAPLPELSGTAKTVVPWLKFLAGQGSGKAASMFDTGHAAEAGMANEKNYEQVVAEAKLPVAQAIYDLWQQGHISLSGEHKIPNELMQGDRLVLRDDASVSRFSSWFDNLPENIRYPYSRLQGGYHNATGKNKNQWDG